MSTSRTASCACGQLRVSIIGKPARVGICNCTQCQRRTGGAFAVGAFFPRNQVSAIEVMNQVFLMTSRAFEQQVGRPKPSEGGGVREAPPHVSYDMLCLSSSQEID